MCVLHAKFSFSLFLYTQTPWDSKRVPFIANLIFRVKEVIWNVWCQPSEYGGSYAHKKNLTEITLYVRYIAWRKGREMFTCSTSKQNSALNNLFINNIIEWPIYLYLNSLFLFLFLPKKCINLTNVYCCFLYLLECMVLQNKLTTVVNSDCALMLWQKLISWI